MHASNAAVHYCDAVNRTPVHSDDARSCGEPPVLARLLPGCGVGTLGGLVGLGGAEFRLPLFIDLFGFVALQAVIVNKAMSLIVVLVAIPAWLLPVIRSLSR